MASIQALYLHIPFCTSRCAYCNFATSACHDDALMDAYVDTLSLQLRRASKAGLLGDVRTIYIGGGTPTHLGARRLNSLVYMVSLSVNLENVVEFTVECNPESLDERMARDLYALGVSRLSIGVQSFDDGLLAAYGRAHSAADARVALEVARTRDFRVSLDLICGGPGQTLDAWKRDVKQAIDLGVDHVSIYPLSIEDGTPLAARVEVGECSCPDEDLQADMMIAAEELLTAAGLKRYEVASYARPGFESRHNTAYWTGVEYLGLGGGAASMLSPESFAAASEAGIFGNIECMDVPGKVFAPSSQAARIRLQAHADANAFAESSGRPILHAEELTAREALLEDTMLAFRRSAGLSSSQMKDACEQAPELTSVFEKLRDEGLLSRKADGSLAPTQRGWLMGNEIFGSIWELAE